MHVVLIGVLIGVATCKYVNYHDVIKRFCSGTCTHLSVLHIPVYCTSTSISSIPEETDGRVIPIQRPHAVKTSPSENNMVINYYMDASVHSAP